MRKKIIIIILGILILIGVGLTIKFFINKQDDSKKYVEHDKKVMSKEPSKTFEGFKINEDNSLLDITTISKNRNDRFETILLKIKNKSEYNDFVVTIKYKQNDNIISKTSMNVKLEINEEKEVEFKTLISSISDDFEVSVDYIKE